MIVLFFLTKLHDSADNDGIVTQGVTVLIEELDYPAQKRPYTDLGPSWADFFVRCLGPHGLLGFFCFFLLILK
jgi:hypothetical protein